MRELISVTSGALMKTVPRMSSPLITVPGLSIFRSPSRGVSVIAAGTPVLLASGQTSAGIESERVAFWAELEEAGSIRLMIVTNCLVNSRRIMLVYLSRRRCVEITPHGPYCAWPSLRMRQVARSSPLLKRLPSPFGLFDRFVTQDMGRASNGPRSILIFNSMRKKYQM
jgi:hypothetical protein